MKIIQKLFLLSVSTASFFGCGLQPDTNNWAEGMRGMAESYQKLLPYMFDGERYANPQHKEFIELYLKKINQNAHSLSQHTGQGLSGNDPLFDVGLKGLKTSLRKSMESYFVGNHDYSQKLLQASANYCSTCHTRTNLGPTFMSWDQFKDLPRPVNPMDRAKIFVATRQFPKVIEDLQQAIRSGELKTEGEKLRALKEVIVVSLKNLESPQTALKSIQAARPHLPSKTAQKTLASWSKSLKKISHTQTKKTDRKWIALPMKKQNFVQATQESLNLHKYLSTEQEKLWRSKAYHRLGKIYESFPSLGFWNLPETYYETCILESPGTQTAKNCYFSIEKRLSDMASSPGMTVILEVEKGNLKKLKTKAFSKNVVPTNTFGGARGDDW